MEAITPETPLDILIRFIPAGMLMSPTVKKGASSVALLAFLLVSCDRPTASQTGENKNPPASSEAIATDPSAAADDARLPLETLDQRASYSIGYRFGSNPMLLS